MCIFTHSVLLCTLCLILHCVQFYTPCLIPIWFSSEHLWHRSVQVWISYEQHVLFYCRILSFELFSPPSNISESRWAMRWNALLAASGCKSGARASLRLKDTGSWSDKKAQGGGASLPFLLLISFWNKYVNLFSVMVIYAIFVARQFFPQIYAVLSRGNFCRKFTHFWV